MSLRLLNYNERRPRSSANSPTLRAHESVLVRAERPMDVAAYAARAKGDNGGQWFADEIRGLAKRRLEAAQKRRAGESVRDEQADGLSFASVRDLRGLQKALDFDVVFKVQEENGSVRSITTSAFSLLTSSMAVADVQTAYESVPTVGELLVMDIDDEQPNTELGQVLDYGHQRPTDPPKPLGETEDYKEANSVGEDRYTALAFKDGFQRAFSQELIDRGGPRIFNELMDLGQHAREVLELAVLRKVIDFYGSRGTNPTDHVMIRNRVGASLFSSTANTPTTRSPSGTRILNNDIVAGENLSALRTRLAGMRNAAGYPVANWPEIILVPDAKWEKAWEILESSLKPGVANQANFWGPNGPGGTVQLVSTPMLDLLTTTSWYGGRPRRQFIRKWKQRPEIAVFGGRGTEPFLRTREGMRVRIGWDMTVAARDHIHWVESLDGTTPPGGA